MIKSIIVCHIATSAGPRFSIHPSEEDLRRELIEYFNEVLADENVEEMPDDATLEEIRDELDYFEDVSTETIELNPEEFWK